MSEIRHTPGPWQVIGRGIFQDDAVGGCEIVHGNGIKGRGNADEAQANSHLIAAAPELLLACERVAQEGIALMCLALVHDAIAKAKGEA